MKKFHTLIILAITFTLFSCNNRNSNNITANNDSLFTKGAGKVLYKCDAPFKDKEIDLYYYIPEGNIEDKPVQIIMHGVNRNAKNYRDRWIEYAKQYGFILLTPHFTEEMFPEMDYQQGAVIDADGNINSKEKVTYNIVNDIFEFFVEKSGSKAKSYNIYGHSAGAQFVHRFMLYCNTPYVNKAISANAGWYTFPTDTANFPYGAGKTMGVMNLDKSNYYKKKMIVLLGDADTLRTSNLRQTPEADAQGLNRFERGNTFFKFCKNDAEKSGCEFNWEMQYVSGAKHSDKQMGPVASKILYEKK